MNWKKIKSKIVLQTPWMKVVQDDVILPNGNKGKYTYVRRTEGVGLIVRVDGKVFLVNQYRYPTGKSMLQFPFEGLEEGENEEDGALRCAAEELGIAITNLKQIGSAYVDAGLNTQKITYFSADYAGNKEATTFDETEDLEIKKLGITELSNMIKSGEIEDFHTIVGIHYLLDSIQQ